MASIENTAEKLTALVPEARVVIGHGQMRERELERVMSDFYHQRYNVLVCSTIIETGIDVPTANTIIIERADNFGLAQLTSCVDEWDVLTTKLMPICLHHRQN